MVFLNSVGFLPAEPGTLRNDPGGGSQGGVGGGGGGGVAISLFHSIASDLETSRCSILPFPTALSVVLRGWS